MDSESINQAGGGQDNQSDSDAGGAVLPGGAGAGLPGASIPDVGNIPGVSNECEALLNLSIGVSQLVLGTSNAQEIIEAAKGDFPGELGDDIQAIAEAVGQYESALGDLQIDLVNNPLAFAALTPAQLTQLEAAGAALSTTRVDQAFENIPNYAEKECTGLVPGP